MQRGDEIAHFWGSLGLTTRLSNVLAIENLDSIQALRDRGKLAVPRIPNVGRISIDEISAVIGWSEDDVSMNPLNKFSDSALLNELLRRAHHR